MTWLVAVIEISHGLLMGWAGREWYMVLFCAVQLDGN